MMKKIPTLFNKYFELLLKFVIFYSVAMYVAEIEVSSTGNSLDGNVFWLWSERVVALLFTFEYFARWWKASRDDEWYGSKKYGYVVSPLGVIDLIAIIPFWIGFFVPVSLLGLVRTLRILRLLKLYRYSLAMRAFISAIVDARRLLSGMGLIVLVLMLFSTVAMYELERVAQPDGFGTLSQCLWYTTVTLTTVGYGDISPTTVAGKVFAQFVMLVGLGIMAAFIGIVGSEVVSKLKEYNE